MENLLGGRWYQGPVVPLQNFGNSIVYFTFIQLRGWRRAGRGRRRAPRSGDQYGRRGRHRRRCDRCGGRAARRRQRPGAEHFEIVATVQY